MKRSCVFFDRDGTLMEDRNYLSDPDGVVLFPDTIPSLKKIAEAGFLMIIVSNQSGIGRGYFTEVELEKVNKRLEDLLVGGGVKLDAFYCCPHVDEDCCDCRKPKSGLILKACEDFDIDLKSSYVVGDKIRDIMTGLNVGTNAILVTTGYGTNEVEKLPKGVPFVSNLSEVADMICKKK